MTAAPLTNTNSTGHKIASNTIDSANLEKGAKVASHNIDNLSTSAHKFTLEYNETVYR